MDNLGDQPKSVPFTADRYQIIAAAGKAAWGDSYKAYDPKLDRTVLLQVPVFRPAMQQAPEAERGEAALKRSQEYVLQAGRVMLGWQQLGIARCLDVSKNRGQTYLVREFIPGANLARLLAELRQTGRSPALAEAVRIGAELAQAIAYAHQKGLLHGMLRPESIQLRQAISGDPAALPTAVVVDLGLVRPGSSLPESAHYPGWPPELAAGAGISRAADVYALAAILYELLNGTPYAAGTGGRFTPAGAPDLLESMLRKILSAPPGRRPDDAAELADALLTLLPSVQKTAPVSVQPAGEATGSFALPLTGGLVYFWQRSLQDPALAPLRSAAALASQDSTASTTVAEGQTAVLDIAGDMLHILLPGGEVRSVAMRPAGLSIGRSADNEVSIEAPGVSRRHARIDFDGRSYLVTDLNSTNGTYIEDSRLAQGERRVWLPGENLRLGEVWLRLERAGQGNTTFAAFPGAGPTRPGKGLPVTQVALATMAGSPLDNSQVQFSPGGQRLGLHLSTPAVSVTPGQSAAASLLVFNRGTQRDTFLIQVQGIPPDWYALPARSVTVEAGGQTEIQVIFQPPRSSQGRAGRHSVALRLASQSAPDQVVEARLALTVSAFTLFNSELRPARLRSGEVGQVLVHNRGNLPETFTLLWEDRLHELVFDPPQISVNVPPGKSAAVEFRPALLRPRWFGGESTHPFRVHVSAQTGQMQTHSGDYQARALVPAWAPAALVVLCIALSCVSLLFLNQLTAPSRYARQTAEAGQTALAQATGQSALAATATALAMENANLATRQAATATAVWSLNDDDQDGLENNLEILAGTLPGVPDTDEDGLKDGDEVNAWKTDPLASDTDSDGIKDGREIETGTNPLAGDTDSDGLPDPIDPDPLKAPTATLFVPPTYTQRPPTATATWIIPPTRTLTPTPTVTRVHSPTPTPTRTITPTPTAQTANLAVSISNGLPNAIPGTTLVYSIQVTNLGPGLAPNTRVIDTLPAGLSNASWTCSASPGSSCLAANGSGNLDALVNLAANGQATINLTASLSPAATGLLANTVSVAPGAGVNDPVSSNNQATDTDTLTPKISLSLTKSDGRSSVFPGQATSYTIVVSNAGPSAVNGISVLDIMPAQLSGVTWTCTAVSGSCPAGPGAGSINTLVSLGPSGSATFNVSAQVLPGATGVISNTASITSPIEPGTNNKTASDGTTILALANLSMKVTTPLSVLTGGQLTYTIVITNSGPSAANSLTLTQLIPSGAVLAATIPPAPFCSPQPGKVVCTLSNLAAGSSAQVQITLTAPPTPGDLVSVVDLQAAEPDPDPTGNSVTVSVPVVSP